METSEAQALVQRYVDVVWNERDVEAVGNLITPGFVMHLRSGRLVIRGPDNLKAYMRYWTEEGDPIIPGLILEATDVTVAGDRVAARLQGQKPWQWPRGVEQEILNHLPYGVEMVEDQPVHLLTLLRLKEGRIAEQWLESTYPGIYTGRWFTYADQRPRRGNVVPDEEDAPDAP